MKICHKNGQGALLTVLLCALPAAASGIQADFDGSSGGAPALWETMLAAREPAPAPPAAPGAPQQLIPPAPRVLCEASYGEEPGRRLSLKLLPEEQSAWDPGIASSRSDGFTLDMDHFDKPDPHEQENARALLPGARAALLGGADSGVLVKVFLFPYPDAPYRKEGASSDLRICVHVSAFPSDARALRRMSEEERGSHMLHGLSRALGRRQATGITVDTRFPWVADAPNNLTVYCRPERG